MENLIRFIKSNAFEIIIVASFLVIVLLAFIIGSVEGESPIDSLARSIGRVGAKIVEGFENVSNSK